MNELGAQLRAWYEAHKRDLPWRHTRDPYRIWLSETILQQTRVQQGRAYYDRFLAAFPTIADLAAAPADEVMKCWQGLGYYSRARNLHAAAREVVSRFGGIFPADYQEVRSLPGIGDYTAAAVCSFAYDQPRAVVDGNVFRVYARLFDIDLPIDSAAGRKAFFALADELLDRRDPAQYNQAVMEFGALHCLPAKPACPTCPLSGRCLALAAGTHLQRPVKRPKKEARDRWLHYFDLRCGPETVLHRRSAGDIWQGLYEFPLLETASATGFEALPLDEVLQDVSFTYLGSRTMPPHKLSHQTLHACFHRLEVDRLPLRTGDSIVPRDALGDYAVPRLLDRYLSEEAALF